MQQMVIHIPSNDNELDNHGISVLTDVQATTEEIMTSIKNFTANHPLDLME